MWTGLVNRKYAEYVMMSASVAGGFIATDIKRDDGWYFAALPEQFGTPERGFAMPLAAFRAAMIRDNESMYIGTGEPCADKHGYATVERIQNLLDVVGA